MNAANERVAFLHFVRETELDHSISLVQLAPGAKVLEFGSGDGFIAQRLAQQGFDVTAVDIAPRYPQQYPVLKIGASELPIIGDSFNFIFSSNVLEHVLDLPATLSELRRVLKQTGSAVFTMPTPAWRLYTLLTLPLKLAFSSRLRRQPLYRVTEPANSQPPQDETHMLSPRKSLVNRGFVYVLRPHGEFPSALHELVTFSPRQWKRVFEQNGFRLRTVFPLPLIYGDILFPWWGLGMRKALVNKHTASCMAYHVVNSEL